MPNLPARDLDHILEHTQELWNDLRGARFFITGGTGFFGKWLLESFVWANDRFSLGARAVVLTRNPRAFRERALHLAEHPAVELHDGDVRSFAFPAGGCTHTIHAATPADPGLYEQEPEEMLDLIIQGTRRVLDFARSAGVSKFLLISSGAVYGRQPPDLSHVGEDFSCAPDPFERRSAYGEGKRVAELLSGIYHERHGLDVKIARGFAFVGPHLPLAAHFAIGNFIRDGLAGGPIRVAGDGTPVRSYLYVADLMIWLWAILLRGKPARPYNVGSEQDLTIALLARKIADYFRTEVEIAKPAQPDAPAQRYVPSTKRAREELGLQTWIGLDEALDRTIRWCRAPQATW